MTDHTMTDHIDAIYVYDAPDAIGLNIGVVAQFLSEILPDTEIEARTDFFTCHLGKFELPQVELLTEEIAARLSEREVRNLVAPDRRDDLDCITPEDRELGVVYLAEPLQDVMRPLIPEDERGDECLHIVYLEHCLGQFDPGESYLRLQIVQHGQPTIISTTGFVEAPALPREYSFRRAQLLAFGMEDATEELDEAFADETFGHGDSRITHVATGFALKALFYRLFDERGCDDLTCPLHEAATHDELAQAHIGDESGLCDRHTRMLIDARADGEAEGNHRRS